MTVGNPARTITPEELKMLIIIASHRGDNPLTIEQIHRRMVPQGVNERNLIEMGFLRAPTDRSGRPIKGVLELTPQAREEVGYWIPRCLAMLDRRIKQPIAPEQAEIDTAFRAWIEKQRPQFAGGSPVLTSQPQEREPVAKVSSSGRKRHIPPAIKPGARTSTRTDPDPVDDADEAGDEQAGEDDGAQPEPTPEPKNKGGRPRNPRR